MGPLDGVRDLASGGGDSGHHSPDPRVSEPVVWPTVDRTFPPDSALPRSSQSSARRPLGEQHLAGFQPLLVPWRDILGSCKWRPSLVQAGMLASPVGSSYRVPALSIQEMGQKMSLQGN